MTLHSIHQMSSILHDGEELSGRASRGSGNDAGRIPLYELVAGSDRGGQLDAGTRAFFEKRLGQSFADVRIHTNAQAASSADVLQARAFTCGSDVFFRAGEYRPHTVEGRFVLAHELAHVAQQRGTGSSATVQDAALEQEAHHSAMQVALGGWAPVRSGLRAPGIQCLKISSGGFGRALERHTNDEGIADSVVKLLQKSPTFMSMVPTLDQHYVFMFDAPHPAGSYNLDSKGEVAPGFGYPAEAVGKRSLLICSIGRGPSFTKAPSADTQWTDRIDLNHSSNAEFIEQLIHESTHAFRFVTGANPPTTTMQDEIDVALKDEIAVRTSTDKALKEIPDQTVNAMAGKHVTSRREVERDISSSNLTYLELFFIGRKLRDLQKAENLTIDEAQQISEQVERNPDAGLFYQHPFPGGPLSEYAYLCRKRELAVKDWVEFQAKNKPGDPGYDSNKETLIQQHAKDLFKGEISYTP